jgi:hypothetical protein
MTYDDYCSWFADRGHNPLGAQGARTRRARVTIVSGAHER